MVFQTFRSLADFCFKDHPHRCLLIASTDNQSLTYSDGYNLLRSVSEKLASLGIRKGDMVLTYTPLSIESVLLCWACCYNGIVFVPVDHNWPGALLKHIMEETAPKLVLTDAGRDVAFDGIPGDYRVLLAGSRPGRGKFPLFGEWLRAKAMPAGEKNETASPRDPAVILYTSGSTGLPKGVVLPQKALMNSGSLAAAHFGWTRDDVFLNLGDLHSMSGLRNTCFAPLNAGASFVIASPEERNNVVFLFDLLERLYVGYLGVAPTVVRQMNILCSATRKNQLSALKAILCTGGPLAKDQLSLFFKNYGKPVLNYYGLTETAGLCAGHSFGTFDPEDNSIGPAVGAELIVLPGNPDDGTGELLVKSDNLMSGYFRKDAETKLVLKNGVFHTGDIVKKRKDGCFELLGRKRNIVKNIHSELIHLEEIDHALESHPAVKEGCACRYARYEEDEKIVAFIVFHEGTGRAEQDLTNELKKHLVARLGKNRIPWRFYIEESLPRNTAGKIQRQQLQEKLYDHVQSNHPGYF